MIARRALVAGCVLLGAGLVLHGAWIPAKAALAQALLNRAWAASRAGGGPVPPWPWADSAPVARLVIAGEAMVVLADAGGESLAFAPSHVAGSALPGTPGTSVISGHRDTHFTRLGRLAIGDEVKLQTVSGSRQRYRVRATRVLPRPELALPPATSGDQLVLVTCWPLDATGRNPKKRYAVFAERI